MLHWDTVNDPLKENLLALMRSEELGHFRLVGGTALSLYLGHRMSVDIDLFTDEPYGSIDFGTIERFLQKTFKCVTGDFGGNAAMGRSYLVGPDNDQMMKLDVYYSMDPFFQPLNEEDGIRMATLDEITAMKVDVVQRGGRKKDFWDLHELLEKYSIGDMIAMHRQRFEWTHDETLIRQNFANFNNADLEPDPICLRGKHWEFIKEDIEDALDTYDLK